ncbi:3-dehydroquinate synthase family protein [Sphaerochaeta sp. PS]|uniref:3-dehydroquinate synthase n=1 Tax=Sphaerochaeta sp. PS TaxID=3076336 RepID=UPI0028A531CE|nr:3-dehydroquinate synthase family protein [Sphaerochaeta sp. PS]MDT4761411.1 3-dehydroquinate synthase family protein [Sphaerochaeta sp. PS]
MNTLRTVTLDNGKETEIFLADDLKDLSAHLGGYGRSVLWVFDTNTAKLFKQLPPVHVVLESGESSKNFTSLERILSTAMDEGLARDGRIIGFGGGVVCDMAAFAASVYMRGCRLTLVPTTLLCMVDAAVGGKTAIDFKGLKNMVGSFYPADEVLICFDTLRTLSEKEFLNGLAEVVKHALLSQDEELYKLLLTKKNEILARDGETLRHLVELSLDVKIWYIEQDPKESLGIRQMLNLGHTFGHALESSSHFGLFGHGSCVAWGTGRALEAGASLGITDKAYATGATKLFKSFGYDMDYRIGRGDWIDFKEHLSKDKKKEAGKVLFVLMEGQGKATLKPLELQMVQHLVIAKPIF